MFCDMLRKLRLENGWTQYDLARKANLSKSAISMLETGARKPSFEVLEIFADIFNVNLDTISGADRVDEVDKIRKMLLDNRKLRALLLAAARLNEKDIGQLIRLANLMGKE